MDDEGPHAAIPDPPRHLSDPNVSVLADGTVVHRVHSRTFGGNIFNPCAGGRTRFAPIRHQHRRCIPSLYAASSVQAAIYETLFHDIPLQARRKTVPRTRVEDRRHTALQLRRDLRLVSLRAPILLKWNVPAALVWGPPTRYRATASWAKAIHDQFDDVSGLIWTSRQCDPHAAMLFFGDRADDADLQVVSVREGRDESFLRDVREAGQLGGIVITE